MRHLLFGNILQASWKWDTLKNNSSEAVLRSNKLIYEHGYKDVVTWVFFGKLRRTILASMSSQTNRNEHLVRYMTHDDFVHIWLVQYLLLHSVASPFSPLSACSLRVKNLKHLLIRQKEVWLKHVTDNKNTSHTRRQRKARLHLLHIHHEAVKAVRAHSLETCRMPFRSLGSHYVVNISTGNLPTGFSLRDILLWVVLFFFLSRRWKQSSSSSDMCNTSLSLEKLEASFRRL